MTGDTWDPAKLEGLRELIDIYHYLYKQGVVGRWVRVYRPDRRRRRPDHVFRAAERRPPAGYHHPETPGPASSPSGPRGCCPKRPTPSASRNRPSRKRAPARPDGPGHPLAAMPPGELIYLNLPLHPGSKLDHDAADGRQSARNARGRNMGYPGVELALEARAATTTGSPATRCSATAPWIDKVAKGTFFFDHSAGADLAARYEVRHRRRRGQPVALDCRERPRSGGARVIDDADRAIVYSGPWTHQTGLQPAHAGTIADSARKGARAR